MDYAFTQKLSGLDLSGLIISNSLFTPADFPAEEAVSQTLGYTLVFAASLKVPEKCKKDKEKVRKTCSECMGLLGTRNPNFLGLLCLTSSQKD